MPSFEISEIYLKVYQHGHNISSWPDPANHARTSKRHFLPSTDPVQALPFSTTQKCYWA
jgi:hypothetical protein